MNLNALDWLARDEGSRYVEEMSDGPVPGIDDIGGRRSALQYPNIEEDEVAPSRDTADPQIIDLNQFRQARVLLSRMESLPTQQASSSSIAEWLETLFAMIARSGATEVDWLLDKADPGRLAPELFVGLLRATSKLEPRPAHWSSFLSRAEQELARRGYNAESVLVGLKDKPANARL